MHAASPRSRRSLARALVGTFALLGWLGAQVAAATHVPGLTGGCVHGGHDVPATGEPGCGHGHDHAHEHAHEHAHAHDVAPTPSPDDGDRAPDHDPEHCALCAHAAIVADVAVAIVALPPAGVTTARVGVRFAPNPSPPRFEPGLARGPPTRPRS